MITYFPETNGKTFGISRFTSLHAFECFIDTDITADNIKVVIPEIECVHRSISEKVIKSHDIGHVRVYKIWVYLRTVGISSMVGSMGENKLYEK